jgi:hypothetical protein
VPERAHHSPAAASCGTLDTDAYLGLTDAYLGLTEGWATTNLRAA